MDVVELPSTPDPTPLFGRAVTGLLPWPSGDNSGRGRDAELPETRVAVRDVAIATDRVADYANVCGFRLSSHVPVTFPHLLGFPLSVWLMTRDDFPFSLIGLVHVRNRITAHEPIPVGASVDVTARMADIRAHRRGIQFDNLVEVHLDGEVAWESASTYLRRGSVPAELAPTNDQGEAGATSDEPGRDTSIRTIADVDPADLPLTARWKLPADIGRRYGAVSGDRNPIHLSAASAKAFGFPRAIAHGMWTKAAALASLGPLDLPVTVDVVFRKPVYLPSTVEFATERHDDHELPGWTFGLRGRDGTPHLAGIVARA